MLLGENSELENGVLLALGMSGSKSAEAILSTLKAGGHSCTLQGIYRVLKKLHDERVLIKTGQMYCVSLSWVMQLMQFTENLENIYLGDRHASELLPNKLEDKKIRKCKNLRTLSDIWMQLLIHVTDQRKGKVAVSYVPHLWFALTDIRRWTHTKHHCINSLKRHFVVLGSRTYADKYINALLTIPDKELTYFAPDNEPLALDRLHYYTVIDDIIISVTIDEITARKVDKLMKSIKSEADINVLDILTFVSSPLNATIKVTKNERAAGAIRNKFKRLFGPLK